MIWPHAKHLVLTLISVLLLPIIGPARAGSFAVPETITVAAGPFTEGSDRDEREAAYRLDEKAYGHSVTRKGRWYENELARRQTSIEAFTITRTLITNAAYAFFVAETGHNPPGVDAATWASYGLIHPFERTRKFAWAGPTPPPGRENHPVVLVNHSDARAYARWLSEKTGEIWRLPTEAQWEKAARGNEGRRFPWGDVYDPRRLNSHDQGPFDTVPVGSYKEGTSPYGLLDGAGQVFEWTSKPAGKGRFIVKGGSWDDKGCGICRPAARHSRPAALKHILIGFRLVRREE